MAPSARYAIDMTGVEKDTAEVKRPGCRMEFMISTYANWPPYLHSRGHRLLQLGLRAWQSVMAQSALLTENDNFGQTTLLFYFCR